MVGRKQTGLVCVQFLSVFFLKKNSFTEISLSALKTEVRQSMKAAFSDGTAKNLKVQWKSYFLFC